MPAAPVATSGDKFVGIDVRPADGGLRGVAAGGQIVTVDPASGDATKISVISEKVALGDRTVVDGNPAADRPRAIATEGDRNAAWMVAGVPSASSTYSIGTSSTSTP